METGPSMNLYPLNRIMIGKSRGHRTIKPPVLPMVADYK
jgi:hypothetical protein